MQPATYQAGEVTVTFAEPKAWDFIQARKEVRDGNGKVDDVEFVFAMAWRAAVAGGFQGGFKTFWETIPATHVAGVLEAAKPFFDKAAEAPSE